MLKTEGIVLQNIKYAETSRIVKIYTQKKGLQTFIFKGVKSKKSKFAPAALGNLNLLEIVAYDNPKKNISLVKEVRVTYQYKSIPFDIKKSSIAIFLNEILGKCIKEEEENPNLYSFLRDTLIFFDSIEAHAANFHLIFLMQLTRFLGFPPLNNYSENNKNFNLIEGRFTSDFANDITILNSKKSEIIFSILKSNFAFLESNSLNNHLRSELLIDILEYYKHHLHSFGELKSLAILKTVLE